MHDQYTINTMMGLIKNAAVSIKAELESVNITK
jgi:hypothetical protein